MEKKKILFTAFLGTSAERLLKNATAEKEYEILLLPNDKTRDSELLTEALQQEHFEYVISLGQRPNIKNKVHIEMTARKAGEAINTLFDCKKLQCCLEQNGLPVRLSANAGTSFCNELYWNGLQYIMRQKSDTQMVFLHVPFEKNISDVGEFRKKLFDGLEEFF